MIRHHIDTDQYVSSVVDVNNTAMYGKRYIVGKLDQTTFIANFRANFTFSPNLTLQTYLQPFISAGSYSDFKEYKKPESYDFLVYGKDNSTISKNENVGIHDKKRGYTFPIFLGIFQALNAKRRA